MLFGRLNGGDGFVSATGFTLHEAPTTDVAVAETANVVRGNSGGGVARTEFSSSTGGWTAGGTFPAVVDDGDDISANPNHTWSAALDTAAIETAFDMVK